MLKCRGIVALLGIVLCANAHSSEECAATFTDKVTRQIKWLNEKSEALYAEGKVRSKFNLSTFTESDLDYIRDQGGFRERPYDLDQYYRNELGRVQWKVQGQIRYLYSLRAWQKVKESFDWAGVFAESQKKAQEWGVPLSVDEDLVLTLMADSVLYAQMREFDAQIILILVEHYLMLDAEMRMQKSLPGLREYLYDRREPDQPEETRPEVLAATATVRQFDRRRQELKKSHPKAEQILQISHSCMNRGDQAGCCKSRGCRSCPYSLSILSAAKRNGNLLPRAERDELRQTPAPDHLKLYVILQELEREFPNISWRIQ